MLYQSNQVFEYIGKNIGKIGKNIGKNEFYNGAKFAQI